MLVIFPARVEGRMINLGGSLDFSYGHIRSHQNERRDETTFIQQRYNLHNFGEIFDPRIGTFLINGTFLTQNSKTNRSGINQDFEFKDYSFALNLIPYISPFSIYYQRVNRANDIAVPDPVIVGKQNPLTVKDRVTTIGGNWSLSVPRLPRVSLSYNQSKLESIDDSRRLPNTLSRFFNLESSGRVRETTVVARYQFNTTDVARLGGVVQKVTGNAFNLSTASRLSSKLFLNTYSRIANRGGGNATGVTFAQERGLGASVFYTPSVLWDTHARIDYSETPGGANATDLKRITAFWSGSYRPANELDMVMSARYFQFDVADARTTSPYLDYHINYRPFFGFSTGYGSSIGNTTTRGSGSEINTLFHRHRAFVNYTRSLEILRFTSSYAASYGVSDTKQKGPGRPASERSTDLMNTLSVGVENTRIRIVHVALAYTFNHVERRSRTVQDLEDQRSHVIQANADSSYFRGILLEDDRLQLQSTASLTQIDGFGPRGITLLLDGRGTYYFLGGGMASLGWTHQDYPGGFFLETDVFSEEIRWTSRYGNASITLGLRGSQTRGPDGRSLDRDTFASTNTIAYRIGKFRFNLDHRWSTDRSSGIEYGSQSIFARASRSF
ncbi:MAG TPA: hypothetical protein EYQ01_10635 [Nitrospira sp.]|nr:hypothetical protein [Candidatus Manganitrophaceae bacterium]